MNINFLLILFITITLTSAARINKSSLPSFEESKLLNSYLPATMQVILHAVEQLKQLQNIGTNIVISSSPHPPGLTTWQIVSKTGNTEVTTSSYELSPADTQLKNENPIIDDIKSEDITPVLLLNNNASLSSSYSFTNKSHEFRPKNTKVFYDKDQEAETSFSSYQLDNLDENEKEDLRMMDFSTTKNTDLLGLSLSFSLIKSYQVPLRSSLQQLAFLYDALNKDARRQGLIKYTGFSNEVLNVLSISSKSGIRKQLKTMLEKTLEGKEITRDDGKVQATKTLIDLGDTYSYLSSDLKRLLPLSYTQ